MLHTYGMLSLTVIYNNNEFKYISEVLLFAGLSVAKS